MAIWAAFFILPTSEGLFLITATTIVDVKCLDTKKQSREDDNVFGKGLLHV
jgi:hypothetical protein